MSLGEIQEILLGNHHTAPLVHGVLQKFCFVCRRLTGIAGYRARDNGLRQLLFGDGVVLDFGHSRAGGSMCGTVVQRIAHQY